MKVTVSLLLDVLLFGVKFQLSFSDYTARMTQNSPSLDTKYEKRRAILSCFLDSDSGAPALVDRVFIVHAGSRRSTPSGSTWTNEFPID